MVLGFVFAPGNMFTGDFDYSGFSGTVNFGKPYAWTARPRALKVRYKAQIGKIDKVGSYDPTERPIRISRIVRVFSWPSLTGRHSTA